MNKLRYLLDKNDTLLSNNYWLKKRIMNGEVRYSLKIFQESPKEALQFEEFQTEKEINEKLKNSFGFSLEDSKEFAQLKISRLYLERSSTHALYIDSCQFEEDGFCYVTMGFRTNSLEEKPEEKMLLSIREKFFKDKELIPVDSKIVNCLVFSDYERLVKIPGFERKDMTEEEIEEAADDVSFAFYHQTNPFKDDFLPLESSLEDTKTWINRQHNGRISCVVEYLPISSAKDLYSLSPVHLIEIAEGNGLSWNPFVLLFYALHGWRSPLRYTREELQKRLRKGSTQVEQLTKDELKWVLPVLSDVDEIHKCYSHISFLRQLELIFLNCVKT